MKMTNKGLEKILLGLSIAAALITVMASTIGLVVRSNNDKKIGDEHS